MDMFIKRWHRWGLKNTFFLALSMYLFYLLAQTPQVDTFIKGLGTLGYIGAFIAGFLFVSTYTALPASYVLFELAKYLSPWEVGLIAGAGAMLGDYTIFRLIKDRVADELKPYLARVGTPKLRRLFRTPYFGWLLPVSGALIIASPLPDEAGISLLGASKMKNTHFLLLSYLLNAIGIAAITLLAQRVS
jgi:hypothetical protein